MQPNRFRMLALAAAIASITSLAHAQAGSASKWWWETYNGSGSVQLKSPGTVSATRNPTGDAAQPATTAATQPPTVIIQATGGALPFNYKDDCYVIDLAGRAGNWFIAAGKINTTTSPAQFTGIMGGYGGSNGAGSGGQQVLTALLGAGSGGNSAYNPRWCGADASCAWNYGSGYGYNGSAVVGAAALPINSYQKCYP
jgi:hypothetical protein